MKTVFIFFIALGLSGCKPPVEETAFNEYKLEHQVQPPGEVGKVSECQELEEERKCSKAPDCQPVKSEDGEFVSCIQTPIQPPPGGVEGGGEETEAQAACNKGSEKDEDEENQALGKPKKNEKVAVCHVPPGNPSALHTICISRQGWENGHKDRHGNEESPDHLGACTQRELDVIGERD